MIFLKKKEKEKTRPMGTETPHSAEEGCSTHWGPLAGSPLAAGAEAGGQLRGAGQVGALRLVGHSPLGVSAADVAGALPLAAGHRALEEEQSRRSARNLKVVLAVVISVLCKHFVLHPANMEWLLLFL